MPDLPLPSDSTDVIKLADWLEIYALKSKDENASKGDLESALITASIVEPYRYEAVEAVCLAVFRELEDRVIGAGDAYPFLVVGAVLELKPSKREYSAYLFCLCLSYFRWSTKRSWEIDINPWLLFEELAAMAAARYIDGSVFRFGTSRTGTKKAMSGFKTTINELCSQVGEGEAFRPQPTLDKKDDKVDLVAWKDFADKKTGKLMMFGQCAAGEKFDTKISEVNPDAFWKQWMILSAVSPHLRSFYIPHRIPEISWDYQGRYGGIIFDRCRVAYWAFHNNREIKRDGRYRKWWAYIVSQPNPRPKPK
jgi:hypothetical protein